MYVCIFVFVSVNISMCLLMFVYVYIFESVCVYVCKQGRSQGVIGGKRPPKRITIDLVLSTKSIKSIKKTCTNLDLADSLLVDFNPIIKHHSFAPVCLCVCVRVYVCTTLKRIYFSGVSAAAAAIASGAAGSAPWLAGFTANGVAAGSAAAAAQAAVGNVAAGSGFALLQTIGATTLMGTPVGLAAGAVGAVVCFIFC